MSAAKLLVVVGAAAMLGGCRFWYKPVPVTNPIGEERAVLAGDTTNVYRDPRGRFEVFSEDSEAVYDGYEQLNRGYRAFERYFGAPAPRLAFVLTRDSVPVIDDALVQRFRARGFTFVRYERPHSVRTRRRYSGIDYGGIAWPIAPTAARTMLARFGDAQLGGDASAPRPDSAVLERLPFWYRAAVIRLVGEAGIAESDLEFVRQKRGHLLPFRDLLVLVRAASADTALDPSRPDDADETTLLMAAQATTLAQYLVERHGPAVLSRLGRGYLAGRPLAAMLAEIAGAPRDVEELERRWRVWVDTRET